MKKISTGASFILALARLQAVLARRFDAGLNGLSLSEFIILYHLSQAKNGHLRRGDLADQLGLTASGITRLLLPMEKIGLVRREANERDARVSLVRLAPGGKVKLADAIERAEELVDELLADLSAKKLQETTLLLSELSATVK